MKVLVLLLLLTYWPCIAQRRVDPRNVYSRVLTVVPMVGSGTVTDPRRPMYAPLPGRSSSAVQSGILTFSFVPSDDGKYALVEYVGRDSAALAPILSDKTLKVFVKGKDQKADIEKQFKQYKKDFDLEKFGTVLP